MMRRIFVLRNGGGDDRRCEDGKKALGLPYETAARALMEASGYVAYVGRHGYHFTKRLATIASERMENADGSEHRWTVDEVRQLTSDMVIPEGTTIGDMTYLCNMAYADFYPKVLKTEEACARYALAVARDPDGYDGMPFCRWTADLIGKGITIDWEKLE